MRSAILCFLLFCGTVPLFAIDPFFLGQKPETLVNNLYLRWTPLQVCILPHVPYCCLFTRTADVYGVNFGVWSLQRRISGVGLSVLATDWYIRGLSVSCVASSRTLDGVSIAIAQMTERCHGAMIGICNLPSPVSGRNNYGLQLGVFNLWNTDYCPSNKEARKEFQVPERGYSFLQIGVVNVAGTGLQIGVVNWNTNSILPFTLLVNYSSAPQSNSVDRKAE